MKLLLIGILFGLCGCGKIERTWTNFTGDLTYKYSKSGVEYVQSDSGLAPHYSNDGKLITCK